MPDSARTRHPNAAADIFAVPLMFINTLMIVYLLVLG